MRGVLLTLALVCAAGLGRHAQAQGVAPTQNEAALGGRNFPVGTLRGRMIVLEAPNIELDGQPDRLSPGARIRSPQQMMLTPAALIGQKLLVNYTRDAAGMVREVWILTPEETRAKRASNEKPLFNFWPFVANTGPRDDGKTPFNQLPRYGQ
ncbi:MAG: hypothetical protein ABIW85_02200 [Variovorax sp.]